MTGRGRQRQAGRCTHRLVEIKIRLALFKVGRLAGLDIRCHGDHPHTAVPVGVLIVGNLFFNIVQHEFQAEQAAAPQRRLRPEVARVMAVAQVDAGRPPGWCET